MQTDDLYNDDCVHPTPHGYYYMAKCFLEFQGLDIGEEKEIPEYLKDWCEKVIFPFFNLPLQFINCAFLKLSANSMTGVWAHLGRSSKGLCLNYFHLLYIKYINRDCLCTWLRAVFPVSQYIYKVNFA